MCNQVQCVIFTSAKLIVFSLVFVCLFVSRIMQHLLERFSQNLMEGGTWAAGKNRYIFVVMWIT